MTARSSGLGVGSPEGWLCARITAAAPNVNAGTVGVAQSNGVWFLSSSGRLDRIDLRVPEAEREVVSRRLAAVLPANLRGADSHTSGHAAPTASAAPSSPGPRTTTAKPAVEVALRTGERFLSVRLPSVYTPKAPVANSTIEPCA